MKNGRDRLQPGRCKGMGWSRIPTNGLAMARLPTPLTCCCGQVVLEVRGAPIVSAECLCSDCRHAGEILESLPGAPSMLDDRGATRFVMYRKDRVRCRHGADFLREHRLSVKSRTRRVVASCCNTPMFLEYTRGHWLSMYGNRWPAGQLPALETRVMTRSRRDGVVLPDDVPNPDVATLRLLARLLAARLAMGFRVPGVDYVEGILDVRQERQGVHVTSCTP